jgi:surfactin synthase thioesterase subunit
LNGRYGGVPQAILDDREMLAALVPAMRGDLTIFETYTYETKGVLPCPISVFGGRRDSSLSVKSLEGWGEHTQSGFHLQLFDAGHLFLQTHRPAIARYVRGVIEKALIVSARTGDSS